MRDLKCLIKETSPEGTERRKKCFYRYDKGEFVKDDLPLNWLTINIQCHT